MNTPPKSPTITTRELADKAMQANRAARLAASERGGPETEMGILLSPGRCIFIGDDVLRPMSAGIAELMRIRRMVEVEITPEEMIFCFARPEQAYEMLRHIKGPVTDLPDEWKGMVFVFSLWLEKDRLEQASAWVTQQLHDFFGSPEVNPPVPQNPQEPGAKAAEPVGGCEPLTEFSPPTEDPGPPVQILCDGPSGSSPSTSTSP